MTASVGVDLSLHAESAADVVLSIVPATGWAVDETLSVTVDGRPVPPVELLDAHGTRVHRLSLPRGEASIQYRGEVAAPVTPAPSDELDPVRYLRPSRYVPSDDQRMVDVLDVGDAAPRELVQRVPEWVSNHLRYVPGASGPTHSALDTLREREGVCRDYAHLTIALLRAAGVPARLVSVFAPGLEPMDFHAVVEAFVEGRWEVVDATRLAPRTHLVRIATGRDAADTAFVTTLGGAVMLRSVEVTAVARADLRHDDHAAAVLLR